MDDIEPVELMLNIEVLVEEEVVLLPFIVALETLEFTDTLVDDTGLIGIFIYT